jgi:hypothetical protein
LEVIYPSLAATVRHQSVRIKNNGPGGGGGHLDSKWVRMYVNKIEYKGLFLNSDRVTRVNRLGYAIRPKIAKGGTFFQK